MSAPDLETALKDLAITLATGASGITLTSGGSPPVWVEGSALASTRRPIPPFATVALGGAVRATYVVGGAIMAIPLSRYQVAELRRMCDSVLNTPAASGVDADHAAHGLMVLAKAAIAWLDAVDAHILDPYSITDARRHLVDAINNVRNPGNTGPRTETEMGEKNDLRATNNKLRDRVSELSGQVAALESENERLSTDLKNGPMPGVALVSTGDMEPSEDTDPSEWSIRVPAVDAIAKAMNVAEPTEDAVLAAVKHDQDLRAQLSEQLAASRAIVMRVAQILGVHKWDADGSEIVEKAQRWSVFSQAIKKRLEWMANHGSLVSDAESRSQELRAVYIQLTGTEPVAKWVSGKPAAAVPASLMDAPQQDNTSPFTLLDLVGMSRSLSDAIDESHPEDSLATERGRMAEMFHKLSSSRVASNEFIQFMNMVILPHLRGI